MRIPPIVDRSSVVIGGNFNPAIFSPRWFSSHGLMSGAEADGARVELIHPELCRFECGDLAVQVSPQQFIAGRPSTHHEMLRDLNLGTFPGLLMHTPVAVVGINRELHFDSGSFETREAVGDRLAPKEAWGEWAPQIAGPKNTTLEHGGLMRLVMRQGRVNEALPGFTSVEVQPSLLPNLITSGIFMFINCHYILPEDSKSSQMDKLTTLMETGWRDAIKKQLFVIDQLQQLVHICKESLSEPKS
jgi:hypothetical protein